MSDMSAILMLKLVFLFEGDGNDKWTPAEIECYLKEMGRSF